MTTFYVFQCLCGNYQVKEVRKGIQKSTLKCFFCNKSTKLKKRNELGFALKHWGPWDNSIAASRVCSFLKTPQKHRKDRKVFKE